jgi:peptidoglycan/xylan/chitin deacetylase (PgdA/CDA1 family)
MIIKNFLFHRVSDEKDQLWPPMPVALFDSLIAYITKRHHVIGLEKYISGNNTQRNGKQPATILFDDGYKDNIEYAVPILQKYHCPASFYVVTDCIDRNIPTWTYIVDYLLQKTRVSSLNLEMEFVPGPFKKNEFSNNADRLLFGSRLKPWMKSLSNNERKQVLSRLQESFADVSVLPGKMMNWQELRQMKDAGFMIGSHSVTHPLLASIKDEGELFFELKNSGERIAAELGQFPETISYPIGSYDERVVAASKKAGYKAGLAVKQRFYNTLKDDQFSIPRVELYDEPMWKCKFRISGAYSWLKKNLA